MILNAGSVVQCLTAERETSFFTFSSVGEIHKRPTEYFVIIKNEDDDEDDDGDFIGNVV
jgi:hypothetical protein